MRLTNDNIMAAFREAAARQQAGDFAAAAELWEEIVAAAPASAEASYNLGRTRAELGQFKEAEMAYRRAVALKPGAVWAQSALAGLLHLTGDWREAETPYAAALALTPDDARLRTDLGHLRLGLGDFAGGWPLYEARKLLPGPESRPLPMDNEWRGEPIARRSLLIWPEQGFGDLIQFARYAPVLQARGADVTLVSPPELTALLSQLPVRVVEHSKSMTLPAPDYWTLAMSVPGHLGLSVADLSGEAYLQAPADRRKRWAGQVPKPAVGIAWRGRSTHPNDARRSLPSAESLLEPLRAAGLTPVDLSEPIGDFADLAAIIEQLELVVSVDTAVAHLAGALGKPCWLLLPRLRQDWRWFQDRDDTPWYDSVRLFRQGPEADWAPVMARVAAEAKVLASR